MYIFKDGGDMSAVFGWLAAAPLYSAAGGAVADGTTTATKRNIYVLPGK